MRCDSCGASAEEKRHSSTLVACSENRAKLTPPSRQVAPSGPGRPGQTRSSRGKVRRSVRDEITFGGVIHGAALLAFNGVPCPCFQVSTLSNSNGESFAYRTLVLPAPAE